MAPCTLSRPPVPTAEGHRDASRGGVLVIVTACLAVDVAGRLVMERAAGPADWSRAAWTPPGWLFGPVLTALYLAMAAAGSLVWLARDRDDVCCPLTGFSILLAAGLGWPLLFFGLHNPLLGLAVVTVLWFLAGLTFAHFSVLSRPAGWLLAPYWGWVTYVLVLNASIVFSTA